MTKADEAYHKSDLYSDVTARILCRASDRCSTLGSSHGLQILLRLYNA